MCKAIFLTQEVFDGFRFDMAYPVSMSPKHQFQLLHLFSMGLKEAAYDFQALYVTQNKYGGHNIMNGTVRHDGTMMARWNANVARDTTFRLIAQVSLCGMLAALLTCG